ncbi:breast cancer type 2 susceptibility protein [Hemiscyllium ocellatum]|uniref:breast cancer type 2 susceptibility protein n=1 Tax=Hemiscyllium ocellatum TaxID=170820 RepID=UPI002966B7CF|nr:breast cancer type 2 susceptibility protein [Hemiscyllium ocellatum]
MYDFVASCREDLGPLCQNWFEELSLSAASNHLKQPRNDARSFISSYFKTPWQKQTLHSQLDCTPSIFSGLTLITPSVSMTEKGTEETWLKGGNSYSSVKQRIKTLYKTNGNETSNPASEISLIKSPILLHNTCRTPQHTYSVQDGGRSLFSPPVSSEISSKRISESLGAEVDPDMSWTSSLATPPSLNPTVIICKAKENNLPQDRLKEVQVPSLLHSNINTQCDAFAIGLKSAYAMPVIGEEESEDVEAVNQSHVSEDDSACLSKRISEDGKPFISRTLSDDSMSFTESTHLGLRRVKSFSRKRKQNSTVGNFQSSTIKTLAPSSADEKCLECIVAKSDCNVFSNNLTLSPVKECCKKRVVLNEENLGVNLNQSPDGNLIVNSLEKELSGQNVTSSSDWSQLNLSELDESHLMNGYSDIMNSSTDALCLKSVGDRKLISNGEANNQQSGNDLEGNIEGSSSVTCVDIVPISQRPTSHSLTDEITITKINFNHCAFANDFSTVDESTENSGAEVKASTPNRACRMQLSKLPTSEIPCTDYYKIDGSTSVQPFVDGWLDLNSETVATRPFPFCKNERAHTKEPMTTLEDQKVSFTDSISNDIPFQPAINSRMLRDGVYSVTYSDAAKNPSLVQDLIKCQVNEEDLTFLLSSLKERPRKFVYTVQDSSNHQAQMNIPLDITKLQNKTLIQPMVLEPSCKLSAPESRKRKNKVATSIVDYPGIDHSEANQKHDTEANENLQQNHCFPKQCDSVENEVVPQHLKDKTDENVFDAPSNGKNWDHFVNSKPVSCNERDGRIFATACHTVAKKLAFESKVTLTNSFGAQAEIAEDSDVLSVVKSAHPERTCVIQNNIMQNKEKSYFEFRFSPFSDANQSPLHYNCSTTKLGGNTAIHNELDSNSTFLPISTQLSTKKLSYTSILSHTVSSQSSCITNILHKTKKLYDLKCKGEKVCFSESLQLKPRGHAEISTSLSTEKQLEESLDTNKGLLNEKQRLDSHTCVEAEKRQYTINAGFHIGNRKIAVLASTLKSRKLIAEIDNDTFLTSSKPVLVQSLPECETKYTESTCTERMDISGIEITMNESSSLTPSCMNSLKRKKEALSASNTEAQLHQPAEVTRPSNSVVPKQHDSARVKSQNAQGDIGSVTVTKEICTLSENTHNPLVTGSFESCQHRLSCSKPFEQCTDLSADTISKENLENENLKVNSAQEVVFEYVPSKNRVRSQERYSPSSSAKVEVKTKSPESKFTTEHVKLCPSDNGETQTFDSSAILSQPKLLGKCTYLTGSQIELTELIRVLEDTDTQFECMQFSNQSTVEVTNKDTNLLVTEHLDQTSPAPLLEKQKDVNLVKSLGLEPSMHLDNKSCNTPQHAASSKMSTTSEICCQNVEEIQQIISDDLVDSFALSNGEKDAASSTVPNVCVNAMELGSDVKIKPVTLGQAVLSLNDNVTFKGKYRGFCAASGNKIKLSVESLRKAANIFKDIDNDQTTAQNNAVNGFSYLLGNSVTKSENLIEAKSDDQKSVEANESHQLCAALGNHSSDYSKSEGILKSGHKIEIRDKYGSGFQSVGRRRFTESEEAMQDKTVYLTTKSSVLKNFDTENKGKQSTIENATWEKSTWQPASSSTKDTGNKELGNSEIDPEMRCFQTASGKRVTVSKGNLDKARRLFETEDFFNENWQNSKLPIEVAKNAPQQPDESVNILESRVVKNDVSMQLSDPRGRIQTELNVTVCPTFTVHSESNISESNSIQNRSLFAAPGTSMKGFQTASGKLVPVCKASLDKAKVLFAEEDVLHKPIKCSTETSACPHTGSPVIQNAKKKPLMNVHSPELLHHINCKSELHPFSFQSKPVSECSNLSNSTEMRGFQTASGKRVNVSEMALSKGRALFVEENFNKLGIQDYLISSTDNKNVLSEDNILNDKEANLPQRLNMTHLMTVLPVKQSLGFFTANGDIVSGSETNVKYVQEKFSADEPGDSKISISDQDAFDVSKPSQQFINTGSIALGTVSGKSVCSSEESLKKCKHLLNDVRANEKIMDNGMTSKEKQLSEEACNPDTSIKKAFLGFNTASGKSVFVSDDALQKVKHVLKEFDNSDSSIISSKAAFCKNPQILLTSTCSSSLFSNAAMSRDQACEEESSELFPKSSNNSAENISVLQNSPQVELNEREIDRSTKNFIDYSNNSVFMSGFQTAKGKKVMVEESSLAAARMHLAPTENGELGHSAERVNMPTGSRNKSISNMNNEPAHTAHALNCKHSMHPNILENNMAKVTVEALMKDDQPLDTTLHKSFRKTYGSINQSVRPNLKMGKRLRSEGKTTEEPLPKRQLLSEFNRTIHSDRKVEFKSLLCNPEGVLCDRRKFMYIVPMKSVACGLSVDKSVSNRIHQQSISPNVTFPIQEDSIQHNLCLQHEVSSLKGQRAVFKPPFQRCLSDCIEQNSSGQTTSKPAKIFVPPFKTISNSNPMESQDNVKFINSSIPAEIGISAKAMNLNTLVQDDSILKHKSVLPRNIRDEFQSVSDISEELQPAAEGISRMVQNLRCARGLQEKRLIQKQKQVIRPQPGSLYRIKNSGGPRLSLHSAVEGKLPTSFTEEQLYTYGVSRGILKVRAENAESFQINSQEFFSEELVKAGNGMQLADGGRLIPDDNGMAGKSEFYRALLDSPGVDPRLINEAWAYNHYKWLVWKLAAMEIAFPKEFGGRCLTPEAILLQLKYRYDVEIDQCCRSALKKIMERDDVAAKTLVVCISKIISMGTKSSQNNPDLDDATKQSKTVTDKCIIEAKKVVHLGVVEVTDGWYGIKALLDLPLTSLLQKRRLVVGQKIIVHGAELIGSQDACTPLEAPESLMIKISANGTRSARWYAKLGFHRDPRPFPLSISSLFNEGGMVGCVDVIVVRVYPMQWMEKKSNGTYIFRNERAEEREAQIHYDNQQRKLELLYANTEAELQERYGVDEKKSREHKVEKLSDQRIMMLQDGVDLYEAIQNSSDPLSVEGYLNEQQLRALNNYRQLLNEQKQAQIEAEFRKALESAENENSYTKRDVSPVWKLCVMDYKNQNSDAIYMLNIWRPVTDLHCLLKEGGRYCIYYLTTSSYKKRLNHADLQLTATKKTRYQQLQPSPEVLEKLYQPRQAVAFRMLIDPFFRAFCKEVDLAGYVIHILGKSGAPTTVYLADENQDLVAVKIWGGLGQLVLEDTIKPGALVGASNLQWKSCGYMGIPTLSTGDLSSFSANPKEGHLREKCTQLQLSVQNLQSFIKKTEEKLMTVLETVNTPRASRDLSAHPFVPTQRISGSVSDSSTLHTPSNSESKTQILSPSVELGSGPALCSTEATSSDSVENLKKKKLSFLSRIPSPAPLSPLCSSISPAVQKGFKPPRRCVIPQSHEATIQAGTNKLPSLKRTAVSKIADDNWVTDEELAMINTQALREGWENGHSKNEEEKITKTQMIIPKGISSENIKSHLDINLGSQTSKVAEDNWVTDEELAMINTQALFEGCANESNERDREKIQRSQIVSSGNLALLPQNSEFGSKVSKIVNNLITDEELAMTNIQVPCECCVTGSCENNKGSCEKVQIVSSNNSTSLQQNDETSLECEFETVIASRNKSSPVVSQSKRRRTNEINMGNSNENTCQSERKTGPAQNTGCDKIEAQVEDDLQNKQVLPCNCRGIENKN